MTLRIKTLKFHEPVVKGYVRKYVQCRECKRVYYRDYVPFSLSNPVSWLPCGHGLGERAPWDTLEEQEGMRLMLAQHEETLK